MYANILLPIDVNEESSWEKALPVAIEYCKAFGAKLHVLAVIPEMPSTWVSQHFPPHFLDNAKTEAGDALKKICDGQIPTEVEADMMVETGVVYECIIETAERIGADLIIMQSHRPELKDYLLGPNAARVVRHSALSVLVVR
jgi:nucleotide-binding universal stress UspA family protein